MSSNYHLQSQFFRGCSNFNRRKRRAPPKAKPKAKPATSLRQPTLQPLWRKEKRPWMVTINGRWSPLRFKDYIEFRAYIIQLVKEGRIPSDAMIRVTRTNDKPSLLSLLWYMFKRRYIPSFA